MDETGNTTTGDSAGQRQSPDESPSPENVTQATPRYSLSVVVPAYNEQRCIGQSLHEIMQFADEYPAICEVIVVDDGSTDRTSTIVESARAEYSSHRVSLKLIRHQENRGKGSAVRTGMLHAAGDVVMFTDADLSSPISELPLLVEPIAKGDYDIVIGSRAVDRSRITVRQSRFRETAGKLFNVFVRCLTGLPISDTQCGFKAFRREALLPVFSVQQLNTFAFDVEVLYVASKLGLRICEIPVHWGHVSHTKVSLIRDSARMFLDLFAIRIHELRGKYEPDADATRH